jgi:hypothetical protein
LQGILATPKWFGPGNKCEEFVYDKHALYPSVYSFHASVIYLQFFNIVTSTTLPVFKFIFSLVYKNIKNYTY